MNIHRLGLTLILVLLGVVAVIFAAKVSHKMTRQETGRQEQKTEYVYHHTENADYQNTKQIEIESVGLPQSKDDLWDVMVYGNDGKTLLYKTQCETGNVTFENTYTKIDCGPDRVYVRGGVVIASKISSKEKDKE